MIESITLQNLSGVAPPVTLTAPRDETIITTRVSSSLGRGIQLCEPEDTASALLHVSSVTVAFEALVDGIRIVPPTCAESDSAIIEGCRGASVSPSTERHTRVIYLRHDDLVTFSKRCIVKVRISSFTATVNERETSFVQVGSSIPDKEDGEMAEGGEESPKTFTNVETILDQVPSGADSVNKVITETPRIQRQYNALASVDHSNLGLCADDIQLHDIHRELKMPLPEGSSASLYQMKRARRESTESEASPDCVQEVIEVAGMKQPHFHEQDLSVRLQDIEGKAEQDNHTAGKSPIESDESIGYKRKRQRLTTYSKVAKNKRSKTSHSPGRPWEEREQSEIPAMKGSQASNDEDAVTGSSKNGTPQTHRTRGGKPGCFAHAPKVMFSNSAVTENAVVMKFFTSHGCKKVDQVGKPFDLLVVGKGELRKRSKLIMAVAQGKPVVTDEWLEQSAKTGRLLDVSEFCPHDPAREQEWGWNASAVAGDTHRDILIGRAVYITPALKKEYTCSKDYKDIEEIAKAAGAKRVVAKAAKDILKQDDAAAADSSAAVILGKDKDDSDCIELLKKGYECFTRDFLPMSILRGELQFEDASLRIRSQAAATLHARRDSKPASPLKRRGGKAGGDKGRASG